MIKSCLWVRCAVDGNTAAAWLVHVSDFLGDLVSVNSSSGMILGICVTFDGQVSLAGCPPALHPSLERLKSPPPPYTA